MKEKTGMRLTVKISILEIAGCKEELRDLLISLRGHEQQGQGLFKVFVVDHYIIFSFQFSFFY